MDSSIVRVAVLSFLTAIIEIGLSWIIVNFSLSHYPEESSLLIINFYLFIGSLLIPFVLAIAFLYVCFKKFGIRNKEIIILLGTVFSFCLGFAIIRNYIYIVITTPLIFVICAILVNSIISPQKHR